MDFCGYWMSLFAVHSVRRIEKLIPNPGRRILFLRWYPFYSVHTRLVCTRSHWIFSTKQHNINTFTVFSHFWPFILHGNGFSLMAIYAKSIPSIVLNKNKINTLLTLLAIPLFLKSNCISLTSTLYKLSEVLREYKFASWSVNT